MPSSPCGVVYGRVEVGLVEQEWRGGLLAPSAGSVVSEARRGRRVDGMAMMLGSHVLDEIIPTHLLDHIPIFMDQTLRLKKQHTLIRLIDLLLHQSL
jgi:hypothetical protein